MANVIFEHLFKQFDENVVVNDFTFKVEDREFVVIVGPSGCGKSTTLRMVAGLESITSGIIKIGEKVVNDIPPKDRNIAMVFQNYALYPHMSVYKNMAFGLKLRKFPADEINRRVNRASEILGIEELLERKPKQLSGGQRQRVAVGRAIVREPQVFLFDEPLSNLDAMLRVQMRAEIRLLHQQLQATMLYVTHDQVEAMTMGDRIVILKDGFLQQAGPPLEIYKRPVNVFVAGFIGSPSMNFTQCTMAGNNDQVSLKSSSFSFDLKSQYAGNFKFSQERELIMGIRPEDFWIPDETRPVADSTFIQGHVNLVETTGAEMLVHFTIGDDALVAKLPSDSEVKFDENIRLGLEFRKIHLFSKESGDSIRK